MAIFSKPAAAETLPPANLALELIEMEVQWRQAERSSRVQP
jgi:hypothetical protein